MAQCPKCGYENEADALNCANCHINLAWALKNSAPDGERMTEAAASTTSSPPGREERRRQFWYGLAFFIGGNIGLAILVVALSVFLSNAVPYDAIAAVAIVLTVTPFLANVAAFIYFGFTRPRFALGMAAGFAVLALIGLCLAAFIGALCFGIGGG